MPDQTVPTHDPRFPIGPFVAPEVITREDRRYAMASLAEMPELLRNAIRPLTDEAINTPYRDGGWTVRQLVHHLADSHMTVFHRTQRALTEDWPEVHAYNEAAFATLHDVSAPVEWSLQLIEGVHARWVMLLQSLTEEQWQRGYVHTDFGRISIELSTLNYGWHSRHHVAHINHLRMSRAW
jgi:hypothetical protein